MEYIYEYFEEIVKPTVDDFLKDKTNIRKGRLAAIVLDHMRDYRVIQLDIKSEKRVSPTEVLLNEIKQECFDLVLIRDVCNASKHCILRSYSKDQSNVKNPRNLTKTSDIRSEKNAGIFGAPFGTSEALFGESNQVYMKFDQEITLKDKAVSSRFLHESINEVLEYWQKTLY